MAAWHGTREGRLCRHPATTAVLVMVFVPIAFMDAWWGASSWVLILSPWLCSLSWWRSP